MYKLIDCGTYLWFVKKSNKYFHCVYSVDGEHKKLPIKSCSRINSIFLNLNAENI